VLGYKVQIADIDEMGLLMDKKIHARHAAGMDTADLGLDMGFGHVETLPWLVGHTGFVVEVARRRTGCTGHLDRGIAGRREERRSPVAVEVDSSPAVAARNLDHMRGLGIRSLR